MKAKKMKISIFLTVLALCLSGCSLAVPDAGEDVKDRLIGAFITPEYLDFFDMDAYLSDHASAFTDGEEITVAGGAEYERRLYADVDKNGSKDPSDWKISFPGVEGACFFSPLWKDAEGADYWGSVCDEEVCDMHTDIKTSDEGGAERALSGTIYILPGKADEDIAYYMNPVYQTKDDRIYAVTGQGFSTSGDSSEGMQMTTKLEEQVALTENGKTVTEKSSVSVSYAVMYRPVKITLCQMDGKNRLLQKTEYNPSELPERLSTEPETEYVLVETKKQNLSGEEVVSREVYENVDEGEWLETFYALENGMIARQSTEVIWGTGK